MIPLKDARAKGQQISKRVAAGYAAYQTAKKVGKLVTDQVCHTWAIDEDYDMAHYIVATDFANAARKGIPGARRNETQHQNRGERTFEPTEWVWVPMKGISYALQARRQGDQIQFRAPRVADLIALRDAVQAEVDRREAEMPDYEPVEIQQTTNILAYGTDGWQYKQQRNSRSFGSVFLPAELQRAIEEDLKDFTQSRERLTKLELAWRRGYLLSGPPGTGKTSLSLAIAGALNFQLATLSLTDLKSDGDLKEAVSTLRKKTVLVIEDIDAYSVSHDRDHNTARDGQLSLSGLLNALDGFQTPEGLVTICTTNHIEHLDPALVRPGRLDRTFTLDHIAPRELERLYRWFYETDAPTPAPEALTAAKLAPAEINELFKQHLNEPADGWAAVVERIEQKAGVRHLEVAA